MQALESIKDFSKHKDSSKLHLGHIWFTHFGCANGFSSVYQAFFGWGFISRCGTYQQSSSLGKCIVFFEHFVFMCSSSTFLTHIDNTSLFFLHVSFGRFRQESYANMWGHYGSRIVGVFSRTFNDALGLTIDILWWYKLFFSMEECSPFAFPRSWALVAPYLCSRFRIFNKPILEEYVSQVEGGPHLLQSCLCAAQNGLPPIAKEMHPSFETLAITDTPCL